MTVATAGGLLFAMSGIPEGADAHTAPAKPTGAVQKPAPAANAKPSTSVAAPTPAGGSATAPGALRSAGDKLGAAKVAAVSAASSLPAATERNTPMRPTGSSDRTVEQNLRERPPASPALFNEQGRTSLKTIVDRAPSGPAATDLTTSTKRTASLDGPGTRPVSSSGSAAGRFNLNTATVDELNRLGGGMIGKAIVRGRPYASPEDLLRRRVVSSTTFERIKAHVRVP
jgi:DNA uptake protein ComE-like DNA-binding protein